MVSGARCVVGAISGPGGIDEESDAVAGIEVLDEILRALDRRALGADLEAARVNGQHERAATSFRRPRLGRIVRRRLLTNELRGHDLAALPVDRDLKRVRADPPDRVAVGVDDLHVDRDHVDRAAKHRLSRGGDDNAGRGQGGAAQNP